MYIHTFPHFSLPCFWPARCMGMPGGYAVVGCSSGSGSSGTLSKKCRGYTCSLWHVAEYVGTTGRREARALKGDAGSELPLFTYLLPSPSHRCVCKMPLHMQRTVHVCSKRVVVVIVA